MLSMRIKPCLFAAAALSVAVAILLAEPSSAQQDDSPQNAATHQAAAEQEEPQVPKFADEDVRFFREQIDPLLTAECRRCHSGPAAKGNLRMDYRGGLLTGGDSGSAIDLESPDASLLIEAVKHLSYEMPPPPAEKLSDEKIALLTEWIKRGLPWVPGADVPPAGEPGHKPPPQVNDETRAFWSFQPVQRPAVPQPKDNAHVEIGRAHV